MGFSALLQKTATKKQEIERCFLELRGELCYQGTYAPLWA